MNFSRRRASRSNPDAAIDITSMIDATFILIIFLLISTTFKKKEHAFTLTLPTASHEEFVIEIERTSVYVTNDGDLFLLQLDADATSPTAEGAAKEGVKMSHDELAQKLKQLLAKDPDLNISILAQENTEYQKVVSTLSILRKAGVVGVQLPYEYAPGGEPGP